MTMTSRASPRVVFRSFVGDAIVGISPIQFDTRRNRNSDTINVDRNPRPRGPIFSSTWSCRASITVSIITCQLDVGTTFRLRTASQPMKRTTTIEIHVMTRVCELKVNPANCTASRTPISCITSTSLGGLPPPTSSRPSDGSFHLRTEPCRSSAPSSARASGEILPPPQRNAARPSSSLPKEPRR